MLETCFALSSSKANYSTFAHALQDCPEAPKLDLLGLTQFILFLYPFFDRTFAQGVSFRAGLAGGTPFHLRFEEGRTDYDPNNEERLWEVLGRSMEHLCGGKAAVYGVGNSGGMDSRVILYIARQQGVSLAPYTLGDSPSDAMHIAFRVAKRLGLGNQAVAIPRRFLQSYAEQLILERPMYSLIYTWYMGGADGLPPFDVHLTGFNGDNMLGSHLPEGIDQVQDAQQLRDIIYGHYLVNSPEALRGYLRPAYRDLPDAVREDFDTRLAHTRHLHPENVFEEFNFMSRQLRFIMQSVNFDFCGRYPWCSPFFTKEFMEFATTLSFAERFGRRLYRNTLRRYMPELRNIRFEREPLSLADETNPRLRNAKQWLWRKGPKLGIKINRGNHKNVQRWMRAGGALDFIAKHLDADSQLFAEVFDIGAIRRQLGALFEERLHLLMALFTVKYWLDVNRDRISL